MWATLHIWQLAARWLFHMTFCFRDAGAGRTLSLKQPILHAFSHTLRNVKLAILTYRTRPMA